MTTASLDLTEVLSALTQLRDSPAKVFGANEHHFVLNPPIAEKDVVSFEQRHRVSLPDDYRYFITQIGNGGAGPYYGVFPLGQMDGLGESLKPWHESDGFVGTLSEPFLFRESWNDLRGKPAEELMKTDEQEYERQLDEFERLYWGSAVMNGAIPVCHEGCALRIWLVICGPEAGNLWHDGRADYSGFPSQLRRMCVGLKKPKKLGYVCIGATPTCSPLYTGHMRLSRNIECERGRPLLLAMDNHSS